MVIKTTAERRESPKSGRQLLQSAWIVTAETEDGKIHESLMVFRNQPLPEDIRHYFERRPEMFRLRK